MMHPAFFAARPSLLGLLLLVLLLAGPGRGWAQAPSFTQALSFNPSGGGGTSVGRAVATDAAGNQYLTGSFEDTLVLGSTRLITSRARGRSLFVAKRSAVTRAWLWVVQTRESGNAHGTGVAVDAAGNALVTGAFSGPISFGTSTASILLTSGSSIAFVAKFEASTGACTWAVQAGGVNGSGVGTGVAVDAGGNALVTGSFVGASSFSTSPLPTVLTAAGTADVFVARFEASTGACTWAVRAGGSYYEYPTGIAVDGGGNAVVAGYFEVTATFGSGPAATVLTSAGNNDGFLAKFGAAAGACAWAVRVGGSSNDYAAAVAVDAGGNALVTGSFNGTATFTTRPAPTTLVSAGTAEAFVAKFEASTGGCAWAVPTSSGGGGSGNGVAVDANGNALVVGAFCGRAGFSTSPTLTYLQATGSCNVFVARFGAATGACAWVVGGGSNTNDYGHGIAVDAAGNALVTGWFRTSALFGRLALVGGSALGVGTGFLVVVASAGTLATAPPAALPVFTLFPNPARSACQVQGAAAGAAVTLLDALGRPLARAVADASGTARLALPTGLAPGLYLVRSGGQRRRLAVE